MGNNEGSTNEDIGRPGPWKEGRYQQPGQPVDQSVRTPAGTSPSPDQPVSTPVTRKDYEFPDSGRAADGDTEPPGGDAG
jgi:hypothetical protein